MLACVGNVICVMTSHIFTFGAATQVCRVCAEWCGPCKAIAPRLEELSKQHTGITFLKVDVDQCEDLAQEYKITAMPTFMAFLKGEKIDTIVGADPSKIDQCLQKCACCSCLHDRCKHCNTTKLYMRKAHTCTYL